MTGCITLTTASDIYTLGYIYYILFDPEGGLGLLLATKRGVGDKLDSIVGISFL